MAIYRLSAKTISRSKGQSAIAAAAYRSGEKLYDEIDNRMKDYGKKSGVLHSEIVLPQNAPEELKDRQTLWNQVEVCEKRKDSQLAREIQFALPREQSQAQNQELIFDYCKKEFVDRGMIADISIHDEHRGNGNKHAHVMLTTREVNENGFGLKNRDWNQKELLQQWRESWTEHVNKFLERNGHDQRIDHRSSYEQYLSNLSEKSLEEHEKDNFQSLAEAEKKPHVSLAATHIAKRGEESWQVNRLKEQVARAKEYFTTKYQEFIQRFSNGYGKDVDRDAEQVRKDDGGVNPKTELDDKLSKGDRDAIGQGGTGESQLRSKLESILTKTEHYKTNSGPAERQLSNDSIRPDKRDPQQPSSGRQTIPAKVDQETVGGSGREPQGVISGPTVGSKDGRGTGKVDSQKTSPVAKEDIQKGDIPAAIGLHHQQSDNSRKEGAAGSGIRISENSELPSVEQVRLKVDKPKRFRAPREPRDPTKGKKAQRRKEIAEFMDRNEHWFKKDPKAASLQLMKSLKIDGKTLERDIKANIKSRKRGQTNEGRERERKREPEGRGM